jgi:hypothetical protein
MVVLSGGLDRGRSIPASIRAPWGVRSRPRSERPADHGARHARFREISAGGVGQNPVKSLVTPASHPADTPSASPIVAGDLDVQIARLETELANLKQRRADRQTVAFLHTIARTIPIGVAFNVIEVMNHAAVDRELADAIGNTTPIALGRRLARVARRPPIAGLVLACVGRDSSGCIWTIANT